MIFFGGGEQYPNHSAAFNRTLVSVLQGVSEAVAHIESLIEAEAAAGVPADRIVVGGFSQVHPFTHQSVRLSMY
jgi:predicted esterase